MAILTFTLGNLTIKYGKAARSTQKVLWEGWQ